jgi:hypothetical protein
MRNNYKVFIDPSCKVSYSSFYIHGLYEVFGKENISFSAKYFKELKRKADSHAHDHYLAFVIIGQNVRPVKIIVDFRDKPSIKENAYEWSDKYAKINYNDKLTDKRFLKKVILIPPGFGIKIWNLWETLYYGFSNYIKSFFILRISLRKYLEDYAIQYKRPVLNDFFSPSTLPDNFRRPYVYFNSRLWFQQNCIEGTNLNRKDFVEHCKAMNCTFEGGFFASADHSQYEEFKNIIARKDDTKTYFEKTKLSTLVFNTPTVHNCHGWKLAEFLAMGKAIISTPFSNMLPVDLEHGKNIHFISDPKELKSAIELLFSNDDYKESLEAGAKEYYLNYVNPTSVIKNIFDTETNLAKGELNQTRKKSRTRKKFELG